jgi:hypothetical protein
MAHLPPNCMVDGATLARRLYEGFLASPEGYPLPARLTRSYGISGPFRAYLLTDYKTRFKNMLEAIVGIIGAGLLGGGAWAVALNSRVSVLEANAVSLATLISANSSNLLTLVDTKLSEVNRRLGRIEHKLDHKDEEL